MIDVTRAHELLIENLPDPPKDDEVEETLQKWKRLNEENESFDDKNEVAVEKEMELKAVHSYIIFTFSRVGGGWNLTGTLADSSGRKLVHCRCTL